MSNDLTNDLRHEIDRLAKMAKNATDDLASANNLNIKLMREKNVLKQELKHLKERMDSKELELDLLRNELEVSTKINDDLGDKIKQQELELGAQDGLGDK